MSMDIYLQRDEFTGADRAVNAAPYTAPYR